jgi:hypothetical protein
MVRLLSDPVLAAKLGKAAEARVAVQFSATKQAEDHIALYLREQQDAKAVRGARQSAAGVNT